MHLRGPCWTWQIKILLNAKRWDAREWNTFEATTISVSLQDNSCAIFLLVPSCNRPWSDSLHWSPAKNTTRRRASDHPRNPFVTPFPRKLDAGLPNQERSVWTAHIMK